MDWHTLEDFGSQISSYNLNRDMLPNECIKSFPTSAGGNCHGQAVVVKDLCIGQYSE